MVDRVTVAAYLHQVAAGAVDRPRALAAAILAEALLRDPRTSPPALQFVEERVRALAGAEGEAGDTAAEVLYEIGSILVELRERFPHLPLGLAGGDGSSDETMSR